LSVVWTEGTCFLDNHTTANRATHANAPNAAIINKTLLLGATFIRTIIEIKIVNNDIDTAVCIFITFVVFGVTNQG
jgi:hypothetical protein